MEPRRPNDDPINTAANLHNYISALSKGVREFTEQFEIQFKRVGNPEAYAVRQ